jgi:FkbM family methyltransferase
MKLQNLFSSSEAIQLMDIGAACINEKPVYKNLLEENLAHLNAFEGDARQIAKIKHEYGDRVTIFTDYLSDGANKYVYLASELSGMTSLLKPNLKALRFFNGFEDFGRIEKVEDIQTRRLDDVEGIPMIDFLKMDIQGSELTVLSNGTKVLQNCLAIQLEVSYICLYQDQPTFGDVDIWMRQNGFAPH